MARENDNWGYKRIQGELQKIGRFQRRASAASWRSSPRPGPHRDTWRQFMRTQASSIIACDLFTVESIRLKTLHVLFFIELHSRRVLIGGVTEGPANLAWCTKIARNLSQAREDRSEPIRFLVHDRDKRFGATFDEVFKAEGVEIIRTPWQAPKAKRLCRAMDPHRPGRVPRSHYGAGHSSRREAAFALRKALQRGAAAPGPRIEASRRFTTLEGP